MILLIGARCGEVLDARWNQFDLEVAVGIKPAATTKQRRLHRAPINAYAAALLRTIRLRVPDDCEWVCGARWEGGRQAASGYQAVLEADLRGIRIHDLRHTFGSMLDSGGMNVPMTGKLLG